MIFAADRSLELIKNQVKSLEIHERLAIFDRLSAMWDAAVKNPSVDFRGGDRMSIDQAVSRDRSKPYNDPCLQIIDTKSVETCHAR